MFAFCISSSKESKELMFLLPMKMKTLVFLYILSHNVFSYDEYNKIENDINISLSYQWKWKHMRHPDQDFRLFYFGARFCICYIVSIYLPAWAVCFLFFNIINFASFKWTTKFMILHLIQYNDPFQLSFTLLSPARPWKLV